MAPEACLQQNFSKPLNKYKLAARAVDELWGSSFVAQMLSIPPERYLWISSVKWKYLMPSSPLSPADYNCSYFKHFTPGQEAEVFEVKTQKGRCPPSGVPFRWLRTTAWRSSIRICRTWIIIFLSQGYCIVWLKVNRHMFPFKFD